MYHWRYHAFYDMKGNSMATATHHYNVFTPSTRTDWMAVVRELGPTFAARAAAHDANDSFVADNYAELKKHKLFSVGVPTELGGGGASHAELGALLREMAHYCGAHRAGAVDAYPSAGGHCLAVASGTAGRTPPQTHCH